jgi:DNA-binding transcriptional regulator YiaG
MQSTKIEWTDKTVLALRQRMGMSQPAFAEMLGVSHRTVTRWESGDDTRPTKMARRSLDKIASGLGSPLDVG